MIQTAFASWQCAGLNAPWTVAAIAMCSVAGGSFGQERSSPPMTQQVAPALTPAPGAATPALAARPAASPETLVERDRLMAWIRALPTKRAAWGDQAHTDGLRQTERQLVKALRGMGIEPTLDPVDHIGGHRAAEPAEKAPAVPVNDAPWHNIIVEFRGTTHPDEVVVFSAHMDAVNNAPGADDDGTGVACILEAARLLKDRPTRRTLRLVLFNLEEVGLVGSRAYTQRIEAAHKDRSSRIVGMVSIDMIGYFTDKPDSQKSPIPASPLFKPPTVGDFVAIGGILRHRTFNRALDAAMRESAPGLKTALVDFFPVAPPDLLRSDHAPFLGIGVPAVIVSDTANFRNPHYHTPTDTIETIDPERFTLAARGLIGAMYRLAGPEGGELINLAPNPRPAAQPGSSLNLPEPHSPPDQPSSTPR